MRIGIITDSVDRKSGSVGIFTENLVESLIETIHKSSDNIEIVLIHSTKNGHSIYKKAKELVIFPELTIEEWKKLSLFRKLILHLKFYKKLHEISKKYDIDVLHFPQFAAASAPPIIFKKPKDVKLVVTLHGVEPLILKLSQYPYARYMFVLKRIYARFGGLKWKIKFKKIVDMIVTVSHSEKMNITHSLGISPNKISVVYHGVPESICTQVSKKQILCYLSRKYEVSKPFILHVSTQHPVKNVIRLIDAFPNLNLENYQLVIVGESKMTPLLKKYIEHRDISNVLFVGHVPFKNIPLFYKTSEILVLPSLRESFGLPVIEAMACGTPVITSNIYATKEIADGVAYLVDPYNTEEIANSISLLLSNCKLRKKLSRRGLKRAKKFSWKRAAKAYLKVYKEVYGKE